MQQTKTSSPKYTNSQNSKTKQKTNSKMGRRAKYFSKEDNTGDQQAHEKNAQHY